MFSITKLTETLKNANPESTRSPYWMILDPQQNMNCDPHHLASQITGPFFCREDAEGFLNHTKYNFSKKAVVYCLSGTYSQKYEDIFKEMAV